jgi:hypothetical protein
MKASRLWALAVLITAIALVALREPADQSARSGLDTKAALARDGGPEGESGLAYRVVRRSATYDPVASNVRRTLDFRSALVRLREHPGLDPAQRAALEEEVRMACAIVRRPDASAERVDDDPNRLPWINALLVRCVGLTDADLEPRDWTGDVLQARNAQLPGVVEVRESREAALEMAKVVVARSADPRLLVESLRYLIEHDALPLDEVFSGVPIPAEPDLDAALLPAADWLACRRTQSCGADGLWTLYTCAQFGCLPGSDLASALFRTLPRMQYEAAQRLVRWLEG